jgi:hypothetical protein
MRGFPSKKRAPGGCCLRRMFLVWDRRGEECFPPWVIQPITHISSMVTNTTNTGALFVRCKARLGAPTNLLWLQLPTPGQGGTLANSLVA